MILISLKILLVFTLLIFSIAALIVAPLSVPIKLKLKWLALFLPALFIEVFCRYSNWFVCLFVRKEARTDRVKRLGNQQVSMMRDYLIKPFMLWQTHDNAVDEGWYGMYDAAPMRGKTQADYDNSWWLRYRCRLWWLNRNTAYGFHHKYFGADGANPIRVVEFGDETKHKWCSLTLFEQAFQLEWQHPFKRRYITINIGWKAHKGFNRLMYANRLIGFRKYK